MTPCPENPDGASASTHGSIQPGHPAHRASRQEGDGQTDSWKVSPWARMTVTSVRTAPPPGSDPPAPSYRREPQAAKLRPGCGQDTATGSACPSHGRPLHWSLGSMATVHSVTTSTFHGSPPQAPNSKARPPPGSGHLGPGPLPLHRRLSAPSRPSGLHQRPQATPGGAEVRVNAGRESGKVCFHCRLLPLGIYLPTASSNCEPRAVLNTGWGLGAAHRATSQVTDTRSQRQGRVEGPQ